MLNTDNVVTFPRKKRKSSYERKGWREIFPTAVVRQFDDFKPLPAHKRLPTRGRIIYMQRFIVIHGLASSVLIDEQNAVIGGSDVLRRARRTLVWNICAFMVPPMSLGDKWALAEAYKMMNEKHGGRS